MSTNDGLRVIAYRPDGTEVDVTEPVRVAYDCVHQSMDWGSGFLDTEEVDNIIRLGAACGFADFQEVIRGVWADREAARRNAGRKSAYDPRVSAWTVRDEATPEVLAEFVRQIVEPAAEVTS